MTIIALATGKLTADPERRTGSSGKPYVMAKLLVHDGEAGTFITLFAFSTTVQDILLALGKGAALSVSGSMKLGIWTPQDGEPHVQASMTVDAVLTAHERVKVDKAVAAARGPRNPVPAPPAAASHHPPRRTPAATADASRRQTEQLWRGNPGATGFDDMADDLPF